MTILCLRLKLTLLAASITLFTLSLTGIAQSDNATQDSSSSTTRTFTSDTPETAVSPNGGSVRGYTPASPINVGVRPFSRVSIGAGISPLGVGVQASTNLTRHLNFRASGNFFQYTVTNFSAQGFNVNANVHLASAGAAVDYYPFHKGFRLSPGLQFYNLNRANATFLAQPGTSFSLNDHNYYSAKGADAVRGIGFLGLGNGSPAFTMTTGWGNTIPRAGRHFSFPFEIGAAFTKTPTFSLALNGFVCDAQGQNCVNVATDPTAQADLAVQVKKYQDDVNLLRFYPIVSFGVAYSFGTRPSTWGK